MTEPANFHQVAKPAGPASAAQPGKHGPSKTGHGVDPALSGSHGPSPILRTILAWASVRPLLPALAILAVVLAGCSGPPVTVRSSAAVSVEAFRGERMSLLEGENQHVFMTVRNVSHGVLNNISATCVGRDKAGRITSTETEPTFFTVKPGEAAAVDVWTFRSAGPVDRMDCTVFP